MVFLCDVAHHIADRPAFFNKVAAKLKPGGRVVIVDFDPAAPEDAPGPPPKMRLSADALVQELAGAGLKQVSVENDLLPYQYILELTKAD